MKMCGVELRFAGSRGARRDYTLSVVGTFVRRHLSHGARHCTSVYTAVGECLGAPVVDYSRNVRREAFNGTHTWVRPYRYRGGVKPTPLEPCMATDSRPTRGGIASF